MDLINNMRNKLLSKKWQNFESLFKNNNGKKDENDDLSQPGVYILAYTDKDIEGQGIRVDEIYYVGMSNSHGGLRQRLKQFKRGIYHGDRHSAARRHFKDEAGGKSYKETREKDGKTFYVAYVSEKCKVDKTVRKSEDLKIMGQIAMLEYYVLAYVKERSEKQEEPTLNKK